MNTCCAGAALTTRSKRGSTGAPAAFGISALSGGSSASRTATDWFDAACLAALSISATILSSTLYGPAQETVGCEGAPAEPGSRFAKLPQFCPLVLT